jgi:hypothetical protein
MLEDKLPEGAVTKVQLTVENSVKLDPVNPIPFQGGGDYFYAITGKKYIPFIGRDDNLPNLLLEARLSSVTHDACITTIAQSTIGNGLTILDQENPKTEFIKWMQNVNNVQISFDEALKSIVEGERWGGNQFVEVIRSQIGTQKTLKLKVHSLLYCRLAEPDEDDCVKSVFVHKLFAKRGLRTADVKKAREIPLWSDNELDKNKVWLKNPNGTESTMLHFKNEVGGIDYYGLPASKTGLRYQKLEGQFAQHNIDDLENNMVLGGMIVFKSGMTPEEARQNGQEILLSHVGAGKTGRWAVLSSESGIKDVDVIPYTTSKEGSFIEVDKRVEEKIIASHNWAKEFCFSDSGALGKGSGYIRALWDLKESSLLNPLRGRLIASIVNPIVKIYSDWFSDKEILAYKYAFKSAMPFSFMGDIEPELFMQVNEARRLASLPPDDKKEGVYLSEMKTKPKDVQNQPTPAKGANNE